MVPLLQSKTRIPRNVLSRYIGIFLPKKPANVNKTWEECQTFVIFNKMSFMGALT